MTSRNIQRRLTLMPLGKITDTCNSGRERTFCARPLWRVVLLAFALTLPPSLSVVSLASAAGPNGGSTGGAGAGHTTPAPSNSSSNENPGWANHGPSGSNPSLNQPTSHGGNDTHIHNGTDKDMGGGEDRPSSSTGSPPPSGPPPGGFGSGGSGNTGSGSGGSGNGGSGNTGSGSGGSGNIGTGNGGSGNTGSGNPSSDNGGSGNPSSDNGGSGNTGSGNASSGSGGSGNASSGSGGSGNASWDDGGSGKTGSGSGGSGNNLALGLGLGVPGAAAASSQAANSGASQPGGHTAKPIAAPSAARPARATTMTSARLPRAGAGGMALSGSGETVAAAAGSDATAGSDDPGLEALADSTSGSGSPVRLLIPAISVDAAVEAVSQAADGTMEMPKRWDDVGWFDQGYQPGEFGSAVVAGHLDSTTDRAVFWDLRKLEPGDRVVIQRADGIRLGFAVVDKDTYRADQAPLERIFGAQPVPTLDLVTCAGTFDRRAASYTGRLVVHTELETVDGGQ